MAKKPRFFCALLALMLIISVFTVTGCANTSEPTTMQIVALKGPTGMGISKLIDDTENGRSAGSYEISLSAAPDDITGGIISGSYDVAAIPSNLASVLYNKTNGEILTAAINTLGVLYILERGDTLHKLSDLKGKTILSSGKGATPEYVLSYLLEQNGLLDDVTVEYANEHSEVVTKFMTGAADIILIPEPFVTSVLAKDPSLRIAFDLTTEWTSASGTALPMGCIVVRKDFASAHPEALNTFLKEYQSSQEYVANNPKEAASLIVKAGIMEDATIAEKSIPNCHIVYQDGNQMKQTLDTFLAILYDENPASVGGSLPGENLYYSN